MAQAVEEWYKQMPIITRSYLTAAVLTSVGCTLEIISPSHLFLNQKRIFEHYEFWRLITNFLYFKNIDLDFLFHMFFLARYCKLLEENSFRGRTADFFYMLLFGATVLTATVFVGGMVPYVAESLSNIVFLSNSLTFMMVYVWSKQNPYIPMSFLGLFTFTAAHLPWVNEDMNTVHETRTAYYNITFIGLAYEIDNSLSGVHACLIVLIRKISFLQQVLLGFSLLIGGSVWVDLLGIIAGHAYFFLKEVYPRMTGRHPLKTPSFIKSLFADDDTVIVAQAADVRLAPPVQDLRRD